MRLDLQVLLLACLAACGGGAKDGDSNATDSDLVVDTDLGSDLDTEDTDGSPTDCPTNEDTATEPAETGDSAPEPTDSADTGSCDELGVDPEEFCGGCPSDSYCDGCLALGDTGPYISFDCIPCGAVCGRPLRADHRQEEPSRAEVVARGDWRSEGLQPEVAGLTPTEQAALAEHWAAQGLDEHASIGSFARFTLELLAHGAPERLIRAAQQAGLDEAVHAREAFGLASAFAGEDRGPSDLPALKAPLQLASDLAELAVATLLDGCLNETLATALATAQRDAATDPAVRAVLERVVDDETRHARLAWEAVAWALEAGGEPVRHALIEALGSYRLPTHRPVSRPVPSHGLLDDQRSRDALEQGWAQVIVPVIRSLLPGSTVLA